MAADLYGDVPLPQPNSIVRFAPGLMVVALSFMAAGYLSDLIGVSLTLAALATGLALNFAASNSRLDPGLGFASQSLLRWGIVLLGARVSWHDISALGPSALLCILLILGATVGIGIITARLLGFTTAFGILAGGAVAICGASAATAIAAIYGRARLPEAQLAILLIGISILSATAMLLYPVLARALELTDLQAGFFIGAAIHDVAQAIGAGYILSDSAGTTATIVKLARVALLAPFIFAITMLHPMAKAQSRRPGMPWFVTGFFLMAGANSAGLVPSHIGHASTYAASVLLAAAVTAIAMRAPISQIRTTHLKMLYPVATATLGSACLALVAAILFM